MMTWWLARARLRALVPPRGRVLDGMLDRSRYGRGLAARLQAADVARTPSAFLRVSFGTGLAGAALAMLWIGDVAGLAGFAAGAVGPEIGLRRRIARRSQRVTAQLAETLTALAAPVRAGASLPQAFAAAAAEAEPPMRDILIRTCRDLDGGLPQDDAIDRFAARCAVPEARLAARALRVGRRAGGELARVIDEIGETLRDRERVAREIRAGTAQARLSAFVVASLPVVFLALMSAGARDQAALLFGEPVGWLLLAIGGGLEAVGIAWIRRLTRPRNVA